MRMIEIAEGSVLPSPVDGSSDVKVYHVTPKRNIPKIMRDGLQPRRGARSRKAGETAPAIYVFPDWLSLEDGVTNWLGDEFDETAVLSVLELTVPTAWLTQDAVRWEATISYAVPPERIRVVVDDLDDFDGKPPEGASFG